MTVHKINETTRKFPRTRGEAFKDVDPDYRSPLEDKHGNKVIFHGAMKPPLAPMPKNKKRRLDFWLNKVPEQVIYWGLVITIVGIIVHSTFWRR